MKHVNHGLWHISLRCNLSVGRAILTLWIIILYLFRQGILNDERRLDGYTPIAADKVVPLQETKTVLEALLTQIGQLFTIRWD